MSTLRKTLTSTAAATVLIGGSLAGPAAASGNGHEYERNGDSNKYRVYCAEDDRAYWSWWAYDKYCEDEHDEDDGKWYFHKGVWFWHAFDEDDDDKDDGKDDGKWRYHGGHGWKHIHDHDDDDDKRWEDKDDDDDDHEREGKKQHAKHHDH